MSGKAGAGESGAEPGTEAERGTTAGLEVTVGRNRPAHVRRERATALTATKRRTFLDMLAATANVKMAARAAGAPPKSFYRLREREPAFLAAWERALEDGYATLEARLLERALGTEEQEPGDGDRAAATPFDPTLALAVLKRRDERARAPSARRAASGYKFVSMAEVERSLLAKLEALERRLKPAGAVAAGPEA